MILWRPSDNEVTRNERGFVNRGKIDKTRKNYGFLRTENKQGVSGEKDPGTEEPEISGDI